MEEMITKMKKNKLAICLFCVLACGTCIYGHGEIRANKTAVCMALDESNTVVTGIWDEKKISKYKYLAIPDPTKVYGFGYRGEYKTVTDIGESAFQGNIRLESVYIPVNIIHIQKNAFWGCDSIKSVQYAGSEQQWKDITIDAGNDVLKNASMKYNATMPKSNDY